MARDYLVFFYVISLLFLVLGLFNFDFKIFVLLRHTPRVINALETDVHRNHKQQTMRSHITDTAVLVNYEGQTLYVIEEKIGIYCEQK
jgi:1,4-dihydroxy-2-naphthoate octaprenyltransferase